MDQRADIWALGVILFEMLTETCTFQKRTTLGPEARLVNDRGRHTLAISPDGTRLASPAKLGWGIAYLHAVIGSEAGDGLSRNRGRRKDLLLA